MSVDTTRNTMIYCRFSNSCYEYMKRYSDMFGTSIADFVRQAVAEKIIKLGDSNVKERN